jgi:hypothetical protein
VAHQRNGEQCVERSVGLSTFILIVCPGFGLEVTDRPRSWTAAGLSLPVSVCLSVPDRTVGNTGTDWPHVHNLAQFDASTTKRMRAALFLVITQPLVVIPR